MVMHVARIAVRFKVDGERLVHALQKAGQQLDGADGEVVLDFSCVRRIDPSALGEMEKLADIADDKAVKVVLRGVNIDIYKVLKLVKLAPRFSFLAEMRNRPEGCHAAQSRE
jgi:anti-anti-sigma regulatory factor